MTHKLSKEAISQRKADCDKFFKEAALRKNSVGDSSKNRGQQFKTIANQNRVVHLMDRPSAIQPIKHYSMDAYY